MQTIRIEWCGVKRLHPRGGRVSKGNSLLFLAEGSEKKRTRQKENQNGFRHFVVFVCFCRCLIMNPDTNYEPVSMTVDACRPTWGVSIIYREGPEIEFISLDILSPPQQAPSPLSRAQRLL